MRNKFQSSSSTFLMLLLLCSSHQNQLGSSLGIFESSTALFRDSSSSSSSSSRWLRSSNNNSVASTRNSSILQKYRTTARSHREAASLQDILSLPAVSKKYYLIYSTGVPLQIILWAVVFAFARVVSSKYRTAATTTILIPIFSSACCVIQLALNMIFTGIGCAGFNKIFGPLRPLFLSILLHWTWDTITGVLLFSSSSSSRRLLVLATMMSSWSIALLPEIIHYVNTRKQVTTTTPTGGVTTNDQQEQKVEILLSVPSMGCVACINKVSNSLHKYYNDNNNVINSSYTKPHDNTIITNSMNHAPKSYHISSWLETNGGIARILVTVPSSSSTYYYNMSLLGEKLSHVIQKSGFPNCTVSSINNV